MLLSGTEPQAVNFATPSDSKFNQLEITNTSAQGLTFNSKAYVAGELNLATTDINIATPIDNSGNIILTSNATITGNYWPHNIGASGWTMQHDLTIGGYLNQRSTINQNVYVLTVNGALNLYDGQVDYNPATISFSSLNIYEGLFNLNGQNLTIPLYLAGGAMDIKGGNLTVTGNLFETGGTMNIDGGRLTVNGNYTIGYDSSGNFNPAGYLQMTNAADYVLVNGNFSTVSGYNHSGNLTNGTLEVKGDFAQSNSWSWASESYYNFNATGNHKVLLSGSGTQSISFSTPDQSRFNILATRNPNYNFATTVNYNQFFILPPSANGTTLFFKPLNQNMEVNGETATFSLHAWDVANLYGADLTLTFDPAKLQVVENSLTIGDAIYGLNIQNNTSYNNTTGVIKVSSSRVGDNNGVSGPGEILQVTFKAIYPGQTQIGFGDIVLADSEAEPIDFYTVPAEVYIDPGISIEGYISLQGVRDYAGGVTVKLVDGGGNIVAQATTDSNGFYYFDQDQNSNPIATGSYAVIASKTVFLTALGDSFTPAIGGLSQAPALKLFTGDIDGDNSVQLADFISLANLYWETSTWTDQNSWSPAADLNRDNQVSIFDLVLLAKNYGKTGYSSN